MVNAQEWLEENYPKEEKCARKTPDNGWDGSEGWNNENKLREDIKKLNIGKKWKKNPEGVEKELEGELKLEGFAFLKEFDCSGNDLTQLDLSDLSNLEDLDCRFNKNLSKIEFPRLSKLERLYVDRKKMNEEFLKTLPTSLKKIYYDNSTEKVWESKELEHYKREEESKGRKIYFDYQTWNEAFSKKNEDEKKLSRKEKFKKIFREDKDINELILKKELSEVIKKNETREFIIFFVKERSEDSEEPIKTSQKNQKNEDDNDLTEVEGQESKTEEKEQASVLIIEEERVKKNWKDFFFFFAGIKKPLNICNIYNFFNERKYFIKVVDEKGTYLNEQVTEFKEEEKAFWDQVGELKDKKEGEEESKKYFQSYSWDWEQAVDKAIELELIEQTNRVSRLLRPEKNDEREEIKNILLIGKTGNGKSTLANILVNRESRGKKFVEVFKESEYSVSETKRASFASFEGAKDIKYKIFDTVGIGDTKFTFSEVIREMAKAVHMANGKFNQVFFVSRGRLTTEELDTFDLLRTVIFDEKIKDCTTVVKNGFTQFDRNEETKKDYEKMLGEGNRRISDLLSLSRKFIHVDAPKDENIRKKTRDVLITELEKCSGKNYEAKELYELGEEIEKISLQLMIIHKKIEDINKSQGENGNSKLHKNEELMKKLYNQKQQDLVKKRDKIVNDYIKNKEEQWKKSNKEKNREEAKLWDSLTTKDGEQVMTSVSGTTVNITSILTGISGISEQISELSIPGISTAAKIVEIMADCASEAYACNIEVQTN
ncbi:MAG: hypothetical protein MRERV_13c028 [Mycoplasmataceae bacterium RV_VA103A]|nr:MAG: hypothetical protein MRERV_13c028 [Mycoplasmataceae bacterium RV_VA103A]